MSANFEAKKAVVEEIKAKITESKSVVLATYDRLSVAEVTALRGKFRDASCEYKVYKNTLVRKAFEELGVTAFDADLNGATADKIVPKSAYVGGAYVDAEGVKKLAAIPSREVLLAKMVGCLQAPIANLAYVMNAIAGQKS